MSPRLFKLQIRHVSTTQRVEVRYVIDFSGTKKLLEEAPIFPPPNVEISDRLFKMGTHSRFRPFHKAFDIATTKK